MRKIPSLSKLFFSPFSPFYPLNPSPQPLNHVGSRTLPCVQCGHGSTKQKITVEPVETTSYSLDVTDVQGCVVRSIFTVEVEDVRCGNNMDKVLMCTKNFGRLLPSVSVCVSPSAVPALLKAGATLGSCKINPCERISVSIAGRDQVYIGYDPLRSAKLIAVVEGAMPPLAYHWSTGETTSVITVAPVVTTEYSVAVTDVLGCVTNSALTVKVEDVRCGNNLDKVQMCKQVSGRKNTYSTICVSAKEVLIELMKGSVLGSCKKSGLNGDSIILESVEPELILFPNPTNGRVNLELNGLDEGLIVIEVHDILGRTVSREEVRNPGDQYRKTIELDKAGSFLISVKSAKVSMTRQVTVIR